MIDHDKIYCDFESTNVTLNSIDFNCEHCGKRYSDESLNLAVFLYGLLCLKGKDVTYFGFTCPSCLMTTLIKEDDSSAELIKRLSSFTSLCGQHFDPQISYFTSIYHVDLLSKCEADLLPIKIPFIKFGIPIENIDAISFELTSFVDNNELQDHLFSFSDNENPPIGVDFLLLFIREENLPDILKYEQEKNVRIIPRYVYVLNIYEQIEQFCARFEFANSLDRLTSLAKSNFAELEKTAIKENISLRGLLNQNPAILHPELMDSLKNHMNQKDNYNFRIASDFMNLLAANPNQLDIPGHCSQIFPALWTNKHPFKGKDIPLSFSDYDITIFKNMDYKSHTAMMDEIFSTLTKSYVQQFILDNYLDFIRDYREIVMCRIFSHADIWQLKEKYLKKVFECIESKKATRPSYRHKQASRKVAEKLWQKDSTITIADMCLRDEICEACDGEVYPEQTLRKWIKDLCPNRKPGRRPKNKSN